jgi:Ca2+-binding RTX toxin-like protein
MATTTYLWTHTDLGNDSGVKALDPAVQSALFTSLNNQHVYNPSNPLQTAWVQEGAYPGGQPAPNIQILETTNTTSLTKEPALHAIIMNDAGGPGHELDVTGGAANLFVAMGTGGDTLKLFDSGNDTVYGGAGNDSIYGGTGHDILRGGGGNNQLHSGSTAGGYSVLYGGSGADTLYGGGGADSLYGGAGQNTLIAGMGQHQLLQAGSGSTLLEHTLAGSGGTDTLIGSAGNDTLMGHQGDFLKDTGPVGSQFWLSGSGTGNSTLQGGKGSDTFHIETNTGNDTIIGGGGSGQDTVNFDHRAFSDLASIQINGASSYTLNFKDGQHVSVTGISDMHFTDSVDLKLP